MEKKSEIVFQMEKPSLTIFLADDDIDDRKFFREALNELYPGAHLTSFDNGVSLIDSLLKLQDNLPDIVFLDQFMPMMSGEECLVDIRSESAFSEIPVVVYSSYLCDNQINTLLKLGASKYLEKPSTLEDMKKELRICLMFLGLV